MFIIKWLANLFGTSPTYGSELEQYILAHRPMNAGDVDRLAREYSQHKGYL
jgi:hypothetical protein